MCLTVVQYYGTWARKGLYVPFELTNDQGKTVDPVPFLVVSLMSLLISYSYGPGYLMALGFTLGQALLICTVVFLAATAGAYHRYVRTERPDLRGEVPAHLRIRRLFLGALIAFFVLGLLALPLFVRYGG